MKNERWCMHDIACTHAYKSQGNLAEEEIELGEI